MNTKKVFILTAADICAIPTLIAYRSALQVAGGEESAVKNLTDEVENLINLYRNEQTMNPPTIPETLSIAKNENVNELVNEICSLKNERDELYEIRAILQDRATKDAIKIKMLSEQGESIAKRLVSAEEENEKVTAERDEHLKVRQIAEKQCNEIEMQNFNNLKEIEALKKELEVRTATITALNKEVEDLRAELKSTNNNK